MDALTALHSRNSVNVLTEPGPNELQLDNIFKAGLRACDHAHLTPWKYLLIEGDARLKFGQLMSNVKSEMDDTPISEALRKSIQQKPLRAPSIIVVVAAITEHPKVPEVEQILSAGASAQMMMTAAHAQGVGAIWRSGALMFHKKMHDGLGLDKNDKIIGFLYLGTPKKTKPLPEYNQKDYVQIWKG